MSLTITVHDQDGSTLDASFFRRHRSLPDDVTTPTDEEFSTLLRQLAAGTCLQLAAWFCYAAEDDTGDETDAADG